MELRFGFSEAEVSPSPSPSSRAGGGDEEGVRWLTACLPTGSIHLVLGGACSGGQDKAGCRYQCVQQEGLIWKFVVQSRRHAARYFSVRERW